jgi:uncharacterized protein (DUF58 family)
MSVSNLDPKILERITRLELKAKAIVEGVMSGTHRSPFKGFSVEFSDHREYVPGDDLRHIDWKVFAKSDNYYIKQYEEETNYRAQILVDASESMAYGEGNQNKWYVAQLIAASLAYLVTSRQDMAGLSVFNKDTAAQLPMGASQSHLLKICTTLETAKPDEGTELLKMLSETASQLTRRGIIIVISDFFSPEDDVVKGLQVLRNKGHEVIALQVMHRDELDFPFKQYTRFEGLEEMGHVLLQPQVLREAYKEEVQAFLETIRKGFRKCGVDYQMMVTDEAIDVSLPRFLSARAMQNKTKR